jgi:predicted DNA-binding protein
MAATKRLKNAQMIYLEHLRAEQLEALAAKAALPKAVLLREAVDDLLVKYKVLKPTKRPALKAAR